MNILWLLVLLCCCNGCQGDGCGRDSDSCGERRDRDDREERSGCGCQRTEMREERSGCGCQRQETREERSGCGCQRQETREERSGCDSARPEPRQPFGNACKCEQ